jgi:hypothetical protein
MAVRLKYAGLPLERIRLAASIERGLDDGLARLEENGTLYVLPTYTALLELRNTIGRRGQASQFWNE